MSFPEAPAAISKRRKTLGIGKCFFIFKFKILSIHTALTDFRFRIPDFRYQILNLGLRKSPNANRKMVSVREIESKKAALSRYLGVSPDKITESVGTLYSFKAFYHGPNTAYLVLTDVEANVAARRAVRSRLWLISAESVFEYFGIDAYPADALNKISHEEIKKINKEIAVLFDKTCGTDVLAEKMLKLGNRANILADFDQKERPFENYFIYRLF